MKKLLPTLFLLAASAAVLATLFSAFAAAQSQTPSPQAASKYLVLDYGYSNGSFSLAYQEIFYGYAPKNLFDGRKGLEVAVLNEQGETLDRTVIEDPRVRRTETFLKNGSIEGKTIELNETSFRVMLPFSKQSASAKLSENGVELALNGLDKAKAFFCGIRNEVCDEDCERDVDCETTAASPTPAAASAAVTTTANAIASVIASPNASPLPSTLTQQPAAQTTQKTQNFDFNSLLALALIVLLAALAVYGLFFSRRKKELGG